MNKSPLAKILLAILAVISIWCPFLCWSFFTGSREIRKCQAEINQVNFNQQIFQMLLQESAEYSKKNPAMETLLRSLNAPPPQAPAPSGAKSPNK
jgi:hypothetical protein